MDRNDKARQEFAHKAFQTAVRMGKAYAIDRFASPIQQGSLVLWATPHDMVWQVIDVKPVLDVRQPPGLMTLVMHCEVPVQFIAGQPAMGLVVVGRQNAPGHAQLDTPQIASGPPAEAPTGQPEALDDDSEPDPKDRTQ